jgi:hypothetical protein
MILTNEYLGYAHMENVEHIVAGSMDSWEIEYKTGKYGIDDTGSIRIAWRNPSDWGVPQFSKPAEQGYTSASVKGNAKVSLSFEYFERPFINSIVVTVYDGFLIEGDTITIVLGDKSKGSNGIRAQTFCEENHEFRVYVDPYGSRRYQRLPDDIGFPIFSDCAAEIHAIAPSFNGNNIKSTILIRALDSFGNISDTFEDSLTIGIIKQDEHSLRDSHEIFMSKDFKGVMRFSWPDELDEGTFYFTLEGKNTGLSCMSNAQIVRNKDMNLYFGDLHGQTSLTVGTGSLEKYFSFARDCAGIDFCGWQGNDFQINDEKWNEVRRATREFNEEDRFITLLGYEWSGLTHNGGDHNVYFFDDNQTFYPSSNWLESPDSVDSADNAPTIPDLFKKVAGRKDVMIIPHIGGRYGTLKYFNPEFTPVIEVHSHHGTFEWFIFDAMKARCKVGFIATSDDHTCRPGMSYPLSKDGRASSFDVTSGFTAIYAESLSRASIWSAIRSRYCYATTFSRMILDVTMAGHHMGEDIGLVDSPNLAVTVHGQSPIDTIDLFNWEKNIGHVNMREKDESRVRIAWSGVRVRTRKKSTKWDGSLKISNGRIINVDEYAFDRKDQGIKEMTDTSVTWISNTSGDYDGLLVDIDHDENTELAFNSEQLNFTIKYSDISEQLKVFHAGGVNLKVEVNLANQKCKNVHEYLSACNIQHQFQILDKNSTGGNAYWVRVLQEDGNMAWSSPIFTE